MVGKSIRLVNRFVLADSIKDKLNFNYFPNLCASYFSN